MVYIISGLKLDNTYYNIFEISPSSSQDEIKGAYHKLAMKHHPDRNQDKESSEARMKEINFIYSILSDSEKRKWYNSTLQEYGGETFSYHNSVIFCDELEVVDSLGNKTKLKVGDNIYYLVAIDKSIITWKYRSKEYFSLNIKSIFDPEQKDNYAKTVKYDFNKTPLCIAHWENSGMVIYKEDFESYWLSQASYSKIDKRNGILTGVIILILFCIGSLYFHSKFSLPSDRAKYLNIKSNENAKALEDDREYYKKEYYASDVEINYILSDFYVVCKKESTLTKEHIELSNVPSKMGIIKGEVPKGVNVLVLLYCPTLNGYKVKYRDLEGWAPGQYLEEANIKKESQVEEGK